jgi:3alpha(or 20beta)-hydroxysteroid dehydrogenase
MSGRLTGKTAIITGAARGQGEAHARRFVAEGAKVVLADVLDDDGARVAAELGASARFVHLDVTSEADWDTAIAAAQELGPLNVLVNNAAIHWVRPIEFESADRLEKIWRVNFLGSYIGMQKAIAPMRAAGGGSIVNVSSTAGLTGLAYHSAYGHTKWALRGVTKVAAVELGGDGIRVNSVHPGPINTNMLSASPGASPDRARFQHLPARRYGEPDEVASLMVFLASDESAFMTGTEFVIDGGSQAGPPPTYQWDPAVHGK